jgi:esterase
LAYLDQFHHKLTGPETAPKLVFLHGLLGYWANWRGVISAFENDYRILAYDQRGHGRSVKPPIGYAPDDYADDLFKILEELGWDQVNLVGHSMGGRAAVNFAYRFPQRIKKLVVEDIGPEPEGDNLEYFKNLFAKVPTPFRDKRLAKELLYNTFNPILGAYLYSNIDETEPGKFDWRFSRSAIFESVREGHARARWDEWQGLKVSTLLIRGELSRTLTRETFDKIIKLNSKIQGVEIAGAGHWIHFEKQTEFISAAQRFLN